MSAETPNDNGTQATETQPNDVEIKATADKATGPKTDETKDEKKALSTLDIVKAKRDEIRARGADTGKTESGSKAAGDAKAQAPAATDETDGGPEQSDVGDKNGSDEKDTLEFTEADFEKPGFFDGLTKEQWKTLEAKFPFAVKVYKAAQREANGLIARVKQKTSQQADLKKPSAVTEAVEDADLSEAIDLLYSKDTYEKGLERLLMNEKSKEIVNGLFQNFVKEHLGVDLEERKALEPFADGITLASKEYPLLTTDDEFWSEVEDKLQEDEKRWKALIGANDPELIAAAVERAAEKVTRSRAARKASEEKKATTAGPKPTERREILERNTKAATEQAGVKANGASRPAVVPSDAKSTAELVRSIREQKGYQHIR